ncbi:Arc family DNA-binding protein [Rhizobium brockwellii]|uniref:Arc family DNA-binding protein n=1 Tax=Rhizobium brockwellii TaxID=3019932 RepID=A0ABU3YXA4_9HYPH|nr:Arc family DNA-binding protein [Rhizobium brockwellii]MDV4183291.1 Arc family DNA-binding protein [Rhizobium brockwellii]MDV4190302.1 Arc family DNA-binding protein [Rhizobium brockwellii]
MAKTERGSEQAMIRLPEGMRDQLKAEAERSGRSMNAEIVDRLEQSFRSPLVLPDELIDRIKVYADRHDRTVTEEIMRLLEREYPQQWDVDERMQYLGTLLAVLKGGTADARINQFIIDVRDTVEGVIGGRVKGVDEKARNEVASLWQQYQEHLAEQEYEDQIDPDLDEEEERMLELVGRTEKLAEPLPDPQRDYFKLTDVLPDKLFSELTKSLTTGDKQGAADLIARIDQEDLTRWIEESKLDWFERERRRQAGEDLEEPPADGINPFPKKD